MSSNVHKPSHYCITLPDGHAVECLDVIETLDLDHHEASALAYIWRAKLKGTHKGVRAEDLEKAIEFLRRKVLLLKAEIEEANACNVDFISGDI